MMEKLSLSGGIREDFTEKVTRSRAGSTLPSVITPQAHKVTSRSCRTGTRGELGRSPSSLGLWVSGLHCT